MNRRLIQAESSAGNSFSDCLCAISLNSTTSNAHLLFTYREAKPWVHLT